MEKYVSVIIPCYNVEKHVVDCIESIKKQTHPFFEVILVNDGSTDSTERKIIETINGDSRFKLFNKENRGLSSARNYGVEKSLYEIITFIDSDDYVSDNFISELLLQYSPETIAQSSVCVVDESSEFINTWSSKRVVKTGESWGKLYNKNKVKLWFADIVMEDNCHYFELLNNFKSTNVAKKAWYYYRQRENSIMKNYKLSRPTVDQYLAYLSHIEKYKFDRPIDVLIGYLSVAIRDNDNFDKYIDYTKFKTIVGRYWVLKVWHPLVWTLGWLLLFKRTNFILKILKKISRSQ